MRRFALSAVLVAIAMTISACQASDPSTSLGNAAGAAAYEWNQPYLAWPDVGDLVCETEDGPCGSPYETLDPKTKAKGTPLRVDSLQVKVGKAGHHELEIGRLAFAEGVHSSTYFKIVNGDTKMYRVSQPHVEFRSLVPGAEPFGEVARERPRVEGVEPVVAILVWDVDFAVDGAIMEIADHEIE